MKSREEQDRTRATIRNLAKEENSRPSVSGTPSHSTPPSPASSNHSVAQKVIPVVEEQLHVTKEVQETGSITFKKRVHTEEISVDDTVTHEEVSISRVPVERRYVDENPPGITQQGDTTIIPVFHEVVEKQLMLVEELRITRLAKQQLASEPLKLYKETVTVDRTSSQNTSSQNASAKDGIEKRTHL